MEAATAEKAATAGKIAREAVPREVLEAVTTGKAVKEAVPREVSEAATAGKAAKEAVREALEAATAEKAVKEAVLRAADGTAEGAAALLIRRSRQNLKAPVSRIKTIIKMINMIRGTGMKRCR